MVQLENEMSPRLIDAKHFEIKSHKTGIFSPAEMLTVGNLRLFSGLMKRRDNEVIIRKASISVNCLKNISS